MNPSVSDLPDGQLVINNDLSALISKKGLADSQESAVENEVVRVTDSKAARCIDSLTSSILILLRWYGVKFGDEVIVSSNTTCSAVLCVLQCGATPVMAEVSEDPTISLLKIRNLITSKTKMIIAGDSGGVSSEFQSLMELVNEPNILSLFRAKNNSQNKLCRPLIIADLTNSIPDKHIKALRNSDVSILLVKSLPGLSHREGGCACFNLPAIFDNQMVCNTLRDLALVAEESRDILPRFLRGNFGPNIKYHGARVRAPERSIKLNSKPGHAKGSSFLRFFLKRTFDILFATVCLIFLAPLLLIVCAIVGIDSKGPVFFRQKRVGYLKKDFDIIKFRTMYVNTQGDSFLTVGDKDPRVTKIGFWLRKYKIDELPQLFNVLKGDMSMVGPRPEVKKYVSLYTPEQQRVLHIKPGITDWSSIEFRNLAELLATAEDPDLYYIDHILPIKLNRSLKYVDEHSLLVDFKIILMTVRKVILP